jgi:RNA polymerase sigma-70 factor (ECF subfamily)
MDSISLPAGGALQPDRILQHAGSIRALALSILGDEHAAEDVLQETWMRALTHPPPHQDSIGGWLRRVAEGIAISRLRSEGRRRNRETHWVEDRDCSHTSYDSTERAEVLRAVVDEVLALDEPYRETVMRRYFEGLPPREIAAATQASVATVNSRLQRAQAKLRERLDRRLSDRCGGMRGAMVALVGWPDPTLAAGATWITKALVWKVGAATAGIASVVALAVLLARDDAPARSVEAPAVVASQGAERADALATVETDTQHRAQVPLTDPTAGVSSGTPLAPPRPGLHAFDLTIEPLDRTGRPLAACDVWLGPDPGPLGKVGTTEWDGALHLAWRGDEPDVELVVRVARVDHGSSPLRKVHVRAGAPRAVRIGIDGGNANEVEGAVPVLERVPIIGRNFSSRPRRAGGRFLLDAAGNGLFEDPWLLAGSPALDAASEVASPVVSQAPAGAPFPADAPRAWLEVRTLDAEGKPVPHAYVTLSAAEGGFREDVATGPSGVTHFPGAPPGDVLVAANAPGRGHPLASMRLTLEPGARRTIDLTLPREPIARVRVVDPHGDARAGWLVELRDDTGSTIGRTVLSAEGRATMAVPNATAAHLFVRADATGPAALLEANLAGHPAEQTFTASSEPRVKSLRVVVRGGDAADCVVRIVRQDSGDGMDAAAADDQEPEGSGTFAFRARGLPAGDYRVLVGSAARGWLDAGVVHVAEGRGPEIVRVELDEPAQLELAGSREATVSLRSTRAGFPLTSPDVPLLAGARMRAAPGAAELVLKRPDSVATVRSLDLQAGQTTRVE